MGNRRYSDPQRVRVDLLKRLVIGENIIDQLERLTQRVDELERNVGVLASGVEVPDVIIYDEDRKPFTLIVKYIQLRPLVVLKEFV